MSASCACLSAGAFFRWGTPLRDPPRRPGCFVSVPRGHLAASSHTSPLRYHDPCHRCSTRTKPPSTLLHVHPRAPVDSYPLRRWQGPVLSPLQRQTWSSPAGVRLALLLFIVPVRRQEALCSSLSWRLWAEGAKASRACTAELSSAQSKTVHQRLGRGRRWAVAIVQSVCHAIIQVSSLLLLPRLLGSRSQLALRAELPMRICHVFLLPGRSGPVLVTAMSLLLCSALLCSDI